VVDAGLIRPARHRENGAEILYDAARLMAPTAALFDPQYWEARDALVGQAGGRGTTWFVEQGTEQWALRHYRRGGFIAQFVVDQYVWTGLERTRAWREWKITAELHALGLPVPAPVAARVVRTGLTYRADLLTLRVPAGEALSRRLARAGLERADWRRLGTVLARFHAAGADHADLNAHNILLDGREDFWLIDFDRAQMRESDRWLAGNLERLHRSLTKLRGLSASFHWTETDWSALLEGYRSGRTGRDRS
jgi:3-deoxy-D-manno-octulosonic acid kinase